MGIVSDRVGREYSSQSWWLHHWHCLPSSHFITFFPFYIYLFRLYHFKLSRNIGRVKMKKKTSEINTKRDKGEGEWEQKVKRKLFAASIDCAPSPTSSRWSCSSLWISSTDPVDWKETTPSHQQMEILTATRSGIIWVASESSPLSVWSSRQPSS